MSLTKKQLEEIIKKQQEEIDSLKSNKVQKPKVKCYYCEHFFIEKSRYIHERDFHPEEFAKKRKNRSQKKKDLLVIEKSSNDQQPPQDLNQKRLYSEAFNSTQPLSQGEEENLVENITYSKVSQSLEKSISDITKNSEVTPIKLMSTPKQDLFFSTPIKSSKRTPICQLSQQKNEITYNVNETLKMIFEDKKTSEDRFMLLQKELLQSFRENQQNLTQNQQNLLTVQSNNQIQQMQQIFALKNNYDERILTPIKSSEKINHHQQKQTIIYSNSKDNKYQQLKLTSERSFNPQSMSYQQKREKDQQQQRVIENKLFKENDQYL